MAGGQWESPGPADYRGNAGPVDEQRTTGASLPDESYASKISAAVRIALLGGFELIVGEQAVSLSAGVERLLAFLALRCRGAVPRALVAGTLWPEVPQRCAYANLRSTLSRLHGVSREALEVDPNEVRLAQGVSVDFHAARAFARRILDPAVPAHRKLELAAEVMDDLSVELLPGWYDDWAVLEADDWRQLRLHALEVLAEEFLSVGRFAEAVAAGSATAHGDPLRESGNSVLIRAHLAEGNRAEALHVFESYRRRLHDELGLEPTPGLLQLMARLRVPTLRDGKQR